MIQTQVFQQVTDLALRGDGRDGGRTVKRLRGAQTFQSFLDAITSGRQRRHEGSVTYVIGGKKR
jgi:hypothetical protein